MSQLLPTLLPPTSSSKAHPPHPAHLHRTRSPTLLPGCCSLLPALGGFLCSGSEAFPHGKGLVGRGRYSCHPATALRSLYIQAREPAGLRHAVWQRGSLAACLLERLLAAPLDQLTPGTRPLSCRVSQEGEQPQQPTGTGRSYTRSAHPVNQGNSSCCQPNPKPSAKQRRRSAGSPLTLALRSLLVP